MKAFVDTSGFFALYSANDLDHPRALDVFRRANSERWTLVTTNAVVFETYALLLNRTGEGRTKAIDFLDAIESSDLHIEHLSLEDERKAIALVRAHEDKTYSLCDASSFVVCERIGIADAIACDDDFRSYGRFSVLL